MQRSGRSKANLPYLGIRFSLRWLEIVMEIHRHFGETLSPSSGSKQRNRGELGDHEHRGSTSLRNVVEHLPHYTALYLKDITL